MTSGPFPRAGRDDESALAYYIDLTEKVLVSYGQPPIIVRTMRETTYDT